ncbi:MAG: ribosome recycling factor [Anaerolineales bacterium]|nr:ribosome recycling factor [Anaerolineales bacterium]
MIDDVKADAENRMKKTIDAFKRELMGIRTGRASPALVEPLKVDFYGAPTPLQQIATVSAPEARLLVIKPFDQSSLSAIEKAILKSDLGLTPMNDGKLIRLPIPQLTEERRRDLTKVVRKHAEEAHVAVRNVRRDALKDLEELEKEKMISEDQHFKGKDLLQEVTDKYIAQVDQVAKAKEAEIMEV